MNSSRRQFLKTSLAASAATTIATNIKAASSTPEASGREYYELRAYESFSELKALAKIAMFHDGEIDVMKDLGMNPIFYGQALAGRDLPHLTYITSGADIASHFAAWKNFGTEPRWVKIKDLAKYKDTVTKNTSRFLTPLSCS